MAKLYELIVRQAKLYWEGHHILAAGISDFYSVDAHVAVASAISEMFSSEVSEGRSHRLNLMVTLSKELWPEKTFVPNVGERVMDELNGLLQLEIEDYHRQMHAREKLVRQLQVHPDDARRYHLDTA